MTKPKILVTSAAGRTGAATVLQLLKKGFPYVHSFVGGMSAVKLWKEQEQKFVSETCSITEICGRHSSACNAPTTAHLLLRIF